MTPPSSVLISTIAAVKTAVLLIFRSTTSLFPLRTSELVQNASILSLSSSQYSRRLILVVQSLSVIAVILCIEARPYWFLLAGFLIKMHYSFVEMDNWAQFPSDSCTCVLPAQIICDKDVRKVATICPFVFQFTLSPDHPTAQKHLLANHI